MELTFAVVDGYSVKMPHEVFDTPEALLAMWTAMLDSSWQWILDKLVGLPTQLARAMDVENKARDKFTRVAMTRHLEIQSPKSFFWVVLENLIKDARTRGGLDKLLLSEHSVGSLSQETEDPWIQIEKHDLMRVIFERMKQEDQFLFALLVHDLPLTPDENSYGAALSWGYPAFAKRYGRAAGKASYYNYLEDAKRLFIGIGKSLENK
jgi:hypothetical protein